MTTPFIDLKSQYAEHKESIDNSIARVLEHGQYIQGPEIAKLETKLAEYLGVKHALACSSGTDSLVLPLMTLDLQKNDAVFTSPFTFFASAEAISLAGGTPVFVDIDPKTYNIDPIALEKKIKAIKKQGKLNPRAVVPIDLFGLSAEYNQILKIASEYELFVLEDAAQAFGANYKGKKAGGFGNAAATSFYPAKPLGCYGDGGAVFTNDSALFEKLKSLRVHGQGLSGDKYDNVRIGLNARMDTIQAAILLEKLKFYDEEIDQRQRVAHRYTKILEPHVTTPFIPDDQNSVWAQYSIQVEDRDKLKSDLLNSGIPTAIFYPTPIHLSSAYSHLGYKLGDFPVSESISRKIISLPMHPYLSDDEVDKIGRAVIASIKNN